MKTNSLELLKEIEDALKTCNYFVYENDKQKFEIIEKDLEILDLMIKKGVDIPRLRMSYSIVSYNSDIRGHQCLDQKEYDNIKELIFKYEKGNY